MTLNIRKIVFVLVLTFGLLPAAAHAAIITYPSRVAFGAAVSGEIVQTWDALADGTLISVLDGITYTPSAGSAVVTNNFLPLSPPNTLGRTPGEFFAGTDTMTFTFSFPITAFAISFNTFATVAGSFRATNNLGDIALSFFDPFPGFTTGQFVGFSSTAPFTSVTISAPSGASFTLDNLTYAPVPEPAALLLVGLGTAAAFYRRRRASRREVP